MLKIAFQLDSNCTLTKEQCFYLYGYIKYLRETKLIYEKCFDKLGSDKQCLKPYMKENKNYTDFGMI